LSPETELRLNITEFEYLLNLPESELLDWKTAFPTGLDQSARTDAHKKARGTLLKDIQALANAPGDAVRHLVYGVHDKISTREVVGITHEIDDSVFRDWVRNAIEPSIRFAYESFEYDLKKIAVFTLYPSNERPHIAAQDMGDVLHKGQVWYRDGSRNRVAVTELRRMFNDTGIQLEVVFGDRERNTKAATIHLVETCKEAVESLHNEYFDLLLALSTQVETLWRNSKSEKPKANRSYFEHPPFAITSQQMKLTPKEVSEITQALRQLKINLPSEALVVYDAYGDNNNMGGWWLRKATTGSHKDWRNALEELLWKSQVFNQKFKIIKDMTFIYRATIAVQNVGSISLEGMRLSLSLDNQHGNFEENPEGQKSRPYPAAPEPPPDPRRFQVFPQRASVAHDLIVAGETEVFFGISVKRQSTSVITVPLKWRIASSSLRKPLEGELNLVFEGDPI
jgi:Putative DNA-binding domain